MAFKRSIRAISDTYYTHFNGFFRRIKKILDYLPILWYDHDYDYEYLLILLRKKIELMIPVFEDGHLLNAKTTVKELKICHHTLNRLIEDSYTDYLHEYLNREYGKIEWKSTFIAGKSHKLVELVREKGDDPMYLIDRKRLTKQADWAKKSDLEILFKTLNRKILHWWD